MNKKERIFEDVVRSIAESEEDVDKILSAARLERHEGPGRHMTGDQKFNLLCLLLAVGGFLGFIYVLFVLAS